MKKSLRNPTWDDDMRTKMLRVKMVCWGGKLFCYMATIAISFIWWSWHGVCIHLYSSNCFLSVVFSFSISCKWSPILHIFLCAWFLSLCIIFLRSMHACFYQSFLSACFFSFLLSYLWVLFFIWGRVLTWISLQRPGWPCLCHPSDGTRGMRHLAGFLKRLKQRLQKIV